MAPAYLIVKLHEGDILMMFDMYRDKRVAQQKLVDLMSSNLDTETSWWKIIECQIDPNLGNGYYDAIVFVDWENTNRIRFIRLYHEDEAPVGLYEGHTYYSERVRLTV